MAGHVNQGIDDLANANKSATDHTVNAAKGAADTIRAAGEKMRDKFQSDVAEPARRAGEAMKASGAKVAEGGSTVSTKMLDQAEANTRAAFVSMRDAAQAKDLSEVMKIQSDFLREQGTRSMTQAREIGELIMQFGRDAIGPLRGQ